LVAGLIIFDGAAAQAQPYAPLRVAVLLTDADDSSGAYDALVDALQGDGEIEVIDPERVFVASDAREVDREDYRKGSRREALESTFRSVMSESGVDAMVLIDMISKGRRVQAVVIGPDGSELADIRASTNKVLASEGGLRAEVLGPALSEIRSVVERRPAAAKAQGSANQNSADQNSANQRDRSEPSTADSAKPDAPNSRASADGQLSAYGRGPRASTRAFKLSVGGLFGRRSFDAESSLAYDISHATPQLGAHAAAQLRLVELMEGRGGVFVEMEGAWAPYTVAFNVLGEPYRKAGRHLSGRLEVAYLQELVSSLSVRVGVGGDVVSDTIDSNPIFTGSRYANGRLTIGFIFHRIDAFELGISGGVMPMILAETSGTSYGDSLGGLGYTGGVELGVTLSPHVVLYAGYDLRAYQTEFTNPQVIESSIQTDELFHNATFGLAYAL
jgi:hypothetical protein